MSYNSSSNRPTAKTQEAPSIRPRTIGIAGLATVALAGAFVSGNMLHDKQQKHESRLEAYKQIDTPVFRTIVLRGGTQLRLTPKELTVSASSGDMANLAGEIPKNEAWVAQAPLVDLKNPQWVAITKPGSENHIHSVDDRIDNTVWVHYGPFIDGNKGGELDWKVNEDGSTSINGDITPLIGSTFKVDAESLALVDGLVDRK